MKGKMCPRCKKPRRHREQRKKCGVDSEADCDRSSSSSDGSEQMVKSPRGAFGFVEEDVALLLQKARSVEQRTLRLRRGPLETLEDIKEFSDLCYNCVTSPLENVYIFIE